MSNAQPQRPCGALESDAVVDVYEYQKLPPYTSDQIELVGCFNDDTGKRDMPKLKRLSAKSPGECLVRQESDARASERDSSDVEQRLCTDADLAYAGLQMGQECWCGNTPVRASRLAVGCVCV